MSLLPQRKKSPEEIARLRETIGVPISPAATDFSDGQTIGSQSAGLPPVDTLVPAHHEATVVHPPETAPLTPLPTPLPTPEIHGPKPVHSLKRSERTVAPEPEKPVITPMPDPRPVRSLKKSEQLPVVAPSKPLEPEGDPKIPYRRHSDRELNEIRRREALALLNGAVPNPKLAVAHPALITPGYLLAMGGAACFFYDEFPLAATAACAATALCIAAAIVLRRPISRHHAAFIAIIALFVIVFGALHYFPHLRHAT